MPTRKYADTFLFTFENVAILPRNTIFWIKNWFWLMSLPARNYPHVRCSMPLFNHSQTVRAMDQLIVSKCSPYHTKPYHTIPPCVMCPVSHVRCHISLVTCHVSHLRCHMSHIFSSSFSFRKWWSSWWRVCYQWGLPHIVFRIFLIKNMLIPKIYLFQLVVVRFWSLKKANWWELNFREIGIG